MSMGVNVCKRFELFCHFPITGLGSSFPKSANLPFIYLLFGFQNCQCCLLSNSCAFIHLKIYISPSLLSFSEFKEGVDINICIQVLIAEVLIAAFVLVNMLSVSILSNSLFTVLWKAACSPRCGSLTCFPQTQSRLPDPRRSAFQVRSFHKASSHQPVCGDTLDRPDRAETPGIWEEWKHPPKTS